MTFTVKLLAILAFRTRGSTYMYDLFIIYYFIYYYTTYKKISTPFVQVLRACTGSSNSESTQILRDSANSVHSCVEIRTESMAKTQNKNRPQALHLYYLPVVCSEIGTEACVKGNQAVGTAPPVAAGAASFTMRRVHGCTDCGARGRPPQTALPSSSPTRVLP